MASIYDLKPAFQRLLRPIVGAFARRGITANQVTVAACILSILTGVLIFNAGAAHPRVLLLLPVVMFLRMALNAIDGMLAREYAMKSALGGFLNELTDVVSDVALYLPMAVIPGLNSFLVVLFVLAAVISEMTGVVAVAQGASRRYDGPMGKSDRAFVIGTLGLLLGVGMRASSWVNLVFVIALVLTVLTIVNRVRSGLREIATN
ncbi:MAG: CDP-alcohol phosphatidyltransferase family protein [Gammaproteobacteria bacterium]